MSLPVTQGDISQLISALRRLSFAFERATTSVPSSTTSSPVISIAGWELVEPEGEQPFKVELGFHLIFEDGPRPAADNTEIQAFCASYEA